MIQFELAEVAILTTLILVGLFFSFLFGTIYEQERADRQKRQFQAQEDERSRHAGTPPAPETDFPYSPYPNQEQPAIDYTDHTIDYADHNDADYWKQNRRPYWET